MRPITAVLLTGLLVPAAATLAEDLEQELERDVVLRAMVDELARSQANLELEDLERPYFIEYALADVSGAYVSAELGAVTGRREARSRSLRADVRVGSYKLDNTNFGGGYGGYWGSSYGGYGRGAAIPIEDDYNAIRQAIWWATDRDYKSVVEALVQKKAFMESKLIKDKPDDFSPAARNIHVDMKEVPELDRRQWRERIREVSAIFRSAQGLQRSEVRLSEEKKVTRLVDSEGAVIRQTRTDYELIIAVQTQAEDGASIADYRAWHTRSPGDLPNRRTMISEAHNLITELQSMAEAPEGEPYVGPVLLVEQAAGGFFAQLFAQELSNPRAPLLENETFAAFFDDSGALANRLNRRILPATFQVVDDPTCEAWDGTRLVGHYAFDEEGVEAKPLVVVQDGWLRALLMSRTPTRDLKESNGRGRASPGEYVKGRPSNLLISTSEPESLRDLRKRLVELAELS
ncbi:MAG: hypothetical protein KAX13_11075, partial [Candidatus Krumholzibacteria bacterium]|nr:hypothetical protein [Candidatus Krumholzibacteria bacterium]